MTEKPPLAEQKRYEVSTFIRPCGEEEAAALCDAILDLPEHKAVGSISVGLRLLTDDYEAA